VRLWTVHPRYLDPQGLVALWRESLLARAVLSSQTKGYQHHPQLVRFQAQSSPSDAINAYLASVLDEAEARGYNFDGSKVGSFNRRIKIQATSGQLEYEWQYLFAKLGSRSPALFGKLRTQKPDPHPLFQIRPGPIEGWERIIASEPGGHVARKKARV
jgi:hypothetical protein